MNTIRLKYGVVPAAGKGTRISQLKYTKILPKPMLPIVGKPILEYVIENLKLFGVKEVFIIVGYKKETIMDYFEDGSAWDIRIEYVEQKEPLGIAHAIYLAKDFISEPFVTILGDDIAIFHRTDVEGIVNTFVSNNAWVVEAVVEELDEEKLRNSCSVILDQDNRILDIVEKPLYPPSRWRGTGIYIFDSRIFSIIEGLKPSPPRNELEITDAIKHVAKRFRKAHAYIMRHSINVNVNMYRDYIEAFNIILKLRQNELIKVRTM